MSDSYLGPAAEEPHLSDPTLPLVETASLRVRRGRLRGIAISWRIRSGPLPGEITGSDELAAPVAELSGEGTVLAVPGPGFVLVKRLTPPAITGRGDFRAPVPELAGVGEVRNPVPLADDEEVLVALLG